MNEENLFPLFHAYNKLVRRGLVKPLTCDTAACGGVLVTGIDKKNMIDEDALILECYSCGAVVRPGLMTIDDVRAVVSEHFMDY